MTNLLQFQGCLIGLALGDALCAPYEGGLIERSLWRIIGKTRDGKARFTDDTQMAMDVAQSLITNRGINQDHLAQTFAQNYRWSRGYGPSASKVLKKIRAGYHWSTVNTLRHPQGSFGNGAAMRIAPVALFHTYHPQKLKTAVTQVSVITHAHPLGIEGAQLIAHIIHETLQAKSKQQSAIAIAKAGLDICQSDRFIHQMRQVIQWLERLKDERNISISPQDVRQVLGNGMAATTSCATAIYGGLAFKDRPFLELIEFVRQIGGDTDTIAAMAGAIWGSDRGVEALDPWMLDSLEQADTIHQIGTKLYDICRS